MKYYILATIELLVLLVATSYVTYESPPHFEVGFKCFPSESEEVLWRTVCTSIFVPMAIEYLLDIIVSYLYPTVHEAAHALEDKVGHGLIISSLIPTSHIPFWIMGDNACHNRDGLVSFAHAMIVCGVLGKLETFSSDIWHPSDAILVMTLFLSAQMSLLLGIIFEDGMIGYTRLSLQLGLFLKFLSTVAFLTSSRNIQLVFQEMKKEQSFFFTTRKYFCSMLFIGLSLFLIRTTVFLYTTLTAWPDVGEATSTRIVTHVIAVIVTAVLPGRIMRRGLQAAEQTIAIQREMNYKKTFVRYISHEVRSPLSTTTIGIDCMIELLQGSKRLSRAELLDLAKDCKVTCMTAVQTLNDLLLFDKIESNMVSLETKAVTAKPFIQECIKPFVRQLDIAGVYFNAVIDDRLAGKHVLIDRLKLEQVLRNFIGNAVKFTPIGGTITVVASLLYAQKSNGNKNKKTMVSDQDNNQVLRVEIRDTGAGISMENQKRLFAQYVQFDANKLQGGKGSGLGLWISKAIVDMHEGTVGATSMGEGQGATFYFEIACYDGPGKSDDDQLLLMTNSADSGSMMSDRTLTPPPPPPVQEIGTRKRSSRRALAELATAASTTQGDIVHNEIVRHYDGDGRDSFDDLRSRGGSSGYNSGGDNNNQSQSQYYYKTTPIASNQRAKRNLLPPSSSEAITTNNGFAAKQQHTGDILLQGKKLRILIADDAALSRKMVERLISTVSTDCAHAVNGQDAVTQVLASMQRGQRVFDVVVIDYYMPGLDGPEAIQEMRRCGYTGMIFAVTASSVAVDKEKLIAAGADLIMAKPFDMKVFRDRIVESLGGLNTGF